MRRVACHTCSAEREAGDSSCGLSPEQNKTERWRGAQGTDYYLEQKTLVQLVYEDLYWFHWFQRLTQRENLPQQDAIGPHVALTAVDVSEEALWRHPPHWQEALHIQNKSQPRTKFSRTFRTLQNISGGELTFPRAT